MTLIPLDALRSDDALGVLAALGTLELLTQAGGLEARLGWDGLGGAALLETDLSDGTSVALRLREVAERIRQAGGLVPASPSLVDRRRSQVEHRARKAEGIEERNDPMRGTREVARDRLLLVAELERDGDGATARWASGLLSMLGVDRAGDAALTPLYAPVGQQVLAQLLEKYLLLACEAGILEEALMGWRRRPDSGANLDHRDLRDAAWSPTGQPDNASVPGATWLALMAVPRFRQVGAGSRADAVGWYRDPRAARPRTLVWPVWVEFRTPEAVDVLLSHPAVREVVDRPDEGGVARDSRLGALGVVAVCKASRAPLGNADGPLQATQVIWL